ncbi:hypothetical protein KP509_12G014300 [Ceratopteris richardii]|nr:hypothetical protein KP509_12G014300 [Ceratopteris richardii]
MSLSFRGVKRLFHQDRSNNTFPRLESRDLSNTQFSESTSSWSPSREHSQTFRIVNALGSCFVPSKKTFEDNEKSGSMMTIREYRSVNDNSGISYFSVAELEQATDHFSPALTVGQGGFGSVYKGRLKDGRLVAIKRARKNPRDPQISSEYESELRVLSSVEHLSLVKFIGYAEEGLERILVVEYVNNGNLRQHLDVKYGIVLDLATRLDIAIDVAHAITYLHLYADHPIIHRDIKSSNVLLTENFRAKVADFGFSRSGPGAFDSTHVSTQVKGTAGYLDPEYIKTYQLTEKSDVYSFGVLLIELFTGRRPIEHNRERNERFTIKWAYQMYSEGRAIETLDPRLSTGSSASSILERVLQLAFECSANKREDRPIMKKAAETLWNIRKEFNSFWNYRPVLTASKAAVSEEPPQN